jgi:GNAT superfamily N-acetyltransferase
MTVDHELTIRRAEPADFEEAWAIVTEYYDAVDVVIREDRRAFLGFYFSDGAGLWLAQRGQAVTGCIALRRLDNSAGEVKRLYVRPDSREQGIAGLLLDSLHEYARAVGYEWLYLDSKDDLAAALRFYERRGYSHCARYNDNPQATIFMRKQLPASKQASP